ncbi:MAG: threonine/homoserine/homoserine lactone efflux protein [Alteromonadaceae bacterium]|jgi:threonine/homoserine/homoserine lactone efflux protein
MTLAAWLPLLMVCILGAMSPGPSLAVVLKHSITNSAKHGVMVAIAHGIGVGIYAVITLLGLSTLLVKSPMVYQGLVYGGAAYLLYMGIKALASKGSPFTTDQGCGAESSYFEAARDGFLIAFLNPKLAIFFVALFSQFIDPENMTLTSGAIMAGTVLVVDGTWYCLVAGLVHKTRERFALADKGPIIDKIAGVVFIGLAIRVMLQA